MTNIEKCSEMSIKIRSLLMDIVAYDSELIQALIPKIHIFQRMKLEDKIEKRIKLIEKLIKLKDQLEKELGE